ncbi:MAG: phosphatase PAP2 family protein [Bacteroides sp.]|jgi:hypothetical protein BACCOPRO_01655
MDALISLDERLFLLLNGLHCTPADYVMTLYSAPLTWLPLYLFLAFLAYRDGGLRRLIWYLLCAGLVVLLADRISVLCFKDIFQRLRPCHNPAVAGLVHLPNGHCGGAYGFVSSHAANMFGIAVLSIFFMRRRWLTWLLLVWALLVGYSRIYMGVHYPGDVLCGAILGSGIGITVLVLVRLLHRYLQPKKWLLERIP